AAVKNFQCSDGTWSIRSGRKFSASRFLHHHAAFDEIGLFRCKFLMHNRSMIYGYARVSTAAQDETGQVRRLKAAGCEKVFREKITGTTADRPQLAKLMKALSPGDVVITPAVDRLSRDTTDLLVIARDMQRAGAGISLAEPFSRYHVRLRRDRLCHSRRRREA